MTKSETQVNFRMPENILVRFKAEIQKERRSQTAQLILLVEEWLEKREKQQDAKA
ncbi:Arc family DNA-binding protein [Acinetobacter junii]|uniref:Arc family DNA-binding protein n=1 Tax=Acinetobacter TaxID=469 RepID=UPI0012509493|nr:MULTISPECIES: Arc family DNA-binding protein [Acinetobacter]MCT9373734.1 Arc family DNA-binding protein [Acinetobacter baumannii]MDH2531500.1 Arc family DNA-binding protein [Acinetobacter baumannii]WRL34257.1 Arc family DNA-binding protein [Acinetobacter junii]